MSDGSRPDQLEGWLRRRLAETAGTPLGTGYQASVHLYDSPVGGIVIKKAHRRPFLSFFTTRALEREHEIYRRLGSVAGIPRSHGLIDGRYLALEYVAGSSLREFELSPERRNRFFEQLLETLQAMHAAGVAHGDLKRKENILVGPGERPYVIDFGVACMRRRSGGVWNRFVFELVKQMDYNAWVKLKYKGRFDELSPDDATRYRPLWIERIARWIRIPWQTITLRELRRRRRRGGVGS